MAGQFPVPQGYTPGSVRVPRRIRDATLSALALAVVVVILARRRGGLVECAHATINTLLGRSGRPDAVSKAVREATAAGVWEVTRRRGWRRVSIFRVWFPPEREHFDEVPRALMDALREGRATPEGLRVWLHLDQALGRQGWTSDTVDELAARIGCSGQTVRRHVLALADVGIVTVSDLGRSGWMLSRPVVTRAAASVRPLVEIKTAGSSGSDLRGSCTEVAPEHLPPDPRSVASATGRRVPEARASATGGGLRPKWRGFRVWRSGAIARPEVLDVVNRLDPDWRTGPARRYLPGLGQIVAGALDAGVPAEAVTTALDTYADLDISGGRHLPGARAGLRTLAADIRLGLACRACGATDDVARGLCPAHRPGDVDEGLAVVEPATPGVPARARAYAEGGLAPEDVEAADPAAAAWMRARLVGCRG